MSKVNDISHSSDCATHNEPAAPAGKCDCGYDAIVTAILAEREACAILAEVVGDSGEQSDVGMGEGIASRRIADAIRSR